MHKLNQSQMQMFILYFKSVYLLRFSYENVLMPALQGAENANLHDKSSCHYSVNSVMLASSLVIDHLARTLKIGRKLSFLNQKKEPFVSYIKSQADIIDARNKIQHINDEIRTNGSGPMLGSVLWVASNGDHLMMSLRSPAMSETIPGLIIDTRTGKTTMEIAYVFNEKYLDLKSAYNSAISFSEFVKGSIKIENGDPVDIFSDIIAMRMNFTLTPIQFAQKVDAPDGLMPTGDRSC